MRQAVETCRTAGVAPSRSRATTPPPRAIGRELDIFRPRRPRGSLGAELDEMDDAALDGAARNTRCSPACCPLHKLRIACALQHVTGEVCAATGDKT